MERADNPNKNKFTLPPIKNYSSRAEWEEACWREVIKSEKLLQSLVTNHERRDIVLRAAALDRLFSGKSYKEIGGELLLSPQTISAIKKSFNEKGYHSYFERGKKERKKKIYSENMFSVRRKRRGRPIRTKYGIVHIPD